MCCNIFFSCFIPLRLDSLPTHLRLLHTMEQKHWYGTKEFQLHEHRGHMSAVIDMINMFLLFVLPIALAFSSKARVSWSKGKISQFNIRSGNKLHSASTGECKHIFTFSSSKSQLKVSVGESWISKSKYINWVSVSVILYISDGHRWRNVWGPLFTTSRTWKRDPK